MQLRAAILIVTIVTAGCGPMMDLRDSVRHPPPGKYTPKGSLEHDFWGRTYFKPYPPRELSQPEQTPPSTSVDPLDPIPKDDAPPLLIGLWIATSMPPGISSGFEFRLPSGCSHRTLINHYPRSGESRFNSEGSFQVRGRVISLRTLKPNDRDEEKWELEILQLTTEKLIVRWSNGHESEYRRVSDSEPLPRLWK